MSDFDLSKPITKVTYNGEELEVQPSHSTLTIAINIPKVYALKYDVTLQYVSISNSTAAVETLSYSKSSTGNVEAVNVNKTVDIVPHFVKVSVSASSTSGTVDVQTSLEGMTSAAIFPTNRKSIAWDLSEMYAITSSNPSVTIDISVT